MQMSFKQLIRIAKANSSQLVAAAVDTLGLENYQDASYAVTQAEITEIATNFATRDAARPAIGQTTVFGVVTKDQWDLDSDDWALNREKTRTALSMLGLDFSPAG